MSIWWLCYLFDRATSASWCEKCVGTDWVSCCAGCSARLRAVSRELCPLVDSLDKRFWLWPPTYEQHWERDTLPQLQSWPSHNVTTAHIASGSFVITTVAATALVHKIPRHAVIPCLIHLHHQIRQSMKDALSAREGHVITRSRRRSSHWLYSSCHHRSEHLADNNMSTSS